MRSEPVFNGNDFSKVGGEGKQKNVQFDTLADGAMHWDSFEQVEPEQCSTLPTIRAIDASLSALPFARLPA